MEAVGTRKAQRQWLSRGGGGNTHGKGSVLVVEAVGTHTAKAVAYHSREGGGTHKAKAVAWLRTGSRPRRPAAAAPGHAARPSTFCRPSPRQRPPPPPSPPLPPPPRPAGPPPSPQPCSSRCDQPGWYECAAIENRCTTRAGDSAFENDAPGCVSQVAPSLDHAEPVLLGLQSRLPLSDPADRDRSVSAYRRLPVPSVPSVAFSIYPAWCQAG